MKYKLIIVIMLIIALGLLLTSCGAAIRDTNGKVISRGDTKGCYAQKHFIGY